MTLTSLKPVWDGSFPDPFLLRHPGGWSAYGTGLADDGRVFPTLHSPDGRTWTPGPGAMARPDDGSTDYWAPEVCERDGCYYLYHSSGVEDVGHVMRVAVADRPEGPFERVETPVLDPASCAFAIDAAPYRHTDGSWFLFYARDLLEGDRPGTALVVAPLDDPLRISDEYVVVARAAREWQTFRRDRTMYGRTWHWHTLEGPSPVPPSRPGGPMRLVYSGGNWTDPSYGVDWLEAPHPMGPWTEGAGGADKPRILFTVGHLVGPGHSSSAEGPDGERVIAFHAWDPEGTARRMFIAPLTDDGDGFAPVATA